MAIHGLAETIREGWPILLSAVTLFMTPVVTIYLQRSKSRTDYAINQDNGQLKFLTEIRNELEDVREENRTLRTQVETLHKDVNDLRTEVGTLRIENAALNREVGRLQEENQTLTRDKTNLVSELATARAENAMLRDARHALEQELSELRQHTDQS